MKKSIVLCLLMVFIAFSFVAGCKKDETLKPVEKKAEKPDAMPTEPAPAPGEEGSK